MSSSTLGSVIREAMAIEAMRAIIARSQGEKYLPDPYDTAHRAVQYADALLARLNEEKT